MKITNARINAHIALQNDTDIKKRKDIKKMEICSAQFATYSGHLTTKIMIPHIKYCIMHNTINQCLLFEIFTRPCRLLARDRSSFLPGTVTGAPCMRPGWRTVLPAAVPHSADRAAVAWRRGGPVRGDSSARRRQTWLVKRAPTPRSAAEQWHRACGQAAALVMIWASVATFVFGGVRRHRW